MKIGILTFWWAQDNYGQLLQCYALQKYLKDMGHEAFLIRYRHSFDKKPTPFLFRAVNALNPYIVYRHYNYKKKNAQTLKERKEFDRGFDDFRKTYIVQSEKEYTKYEELKKNPPVADAYIVGSDQVWNYRFLDTPRSLPYHAYFLDFGSEETKRMSYAASWGVTSLPDKVKKVISPLIQKFDYVSVREEGGTELCKQCGVPSAEWVCDPTLLLSADSYRQLYSDKIRKLSAKYVFLYMLGNECDFDIQNVYDWAGKNSLEVVYVTGNAIVDNNKKFFATIPEWIYLIDNAEYVITNSYHCGVFSTIFGKRFGIVPLKGKDAGMNARFDSLFELRGTGDRFISDKDFSVLEKTYEAKQVEVSKNFLNFLQCTNVS